MEARKFKENALEKKVHQITDRFWSDSYANNG